jgi:hypothetical protein
MASKYLDSLPEPLICAGAGAGSGNGNFNGNKASLNLSLFAIKPTTTEVHNHIQITEKKTSAAGTVLMIGSGLAMGAAAVWGASKLFESNTEMMVKEDEEEDGEKEPRTMEEETTTHMSAQMQLKILRKKRTKMVAA